MLGYLGILHQQIWQILFSHIHVSTFRDKREKLKIKKKTCQRWAVAQKLFP